MLTAQPCVPSLAEFGFGLVSLPLLTSLTYTSYTVFCTSFITVTKLNDRWRYDMVVLHAVHVMLYVCSVHGGGVLHGVSARLHGADLRLSTV